MNSNGSADTSVNAQIESSNSSLSVSPAPEARHTLAQSDDAPNASAIAAALPMPRTPQSQDVLMGRDKGSAARDHFVPEPERYELRSSAIHHFNLQRRDFFKVMGAGIAI